MGDLVVGNRQGSDCRNGENARPLRRRRTLPGGRAVVGGFLVTVSGIGAFAGYTNATADNRVGYLVARSDLTSGQRIGRDSVGYLPMELPDVVRGRAFRDPDDLLGAVVVGPVNEGELIQNSDVLLRGTAPTGREVSFSIEPDRAVDGRLQRGEMIDVLVTYGTGSEAYTVTVARDVRVINRRQPRGTLGDGKDEVITVSVGSSAEALALAHAVTAGAVTLVRTAGASETASGRASGGGGAGGGGATYQAPGPGAEPNPEPVAGG